MGGCIGVLFGRLRFFFFFMGEEGGRTTKQNFAKLFFSLFH